MLAATVLAAERLLGEIDNMIASEVHQFWQALLTEYRAIVAPKRKRDYWFMRQFGRLLALVGFVRNADEYLDYIATTIGNTIYLPRTLSETIAADGVDSMALCVHELAHVVQFRQRGWFHFCLDYLFYPLRRESYEYWARSAAYDLMAYLSGVTDPKDRSEVSHDVAWSAIGYLRGGKAAAAQ